MATDLTVSLENRPSSAPYPAYTPPADLAEPEPVPSVDGTGRC